MEYVISTPKKQKRKKKQGMISGGHNHKGAANHQLTLPINKLIIHHICIHRTIFPGLTCMLEEQGAQGCASIMESTTNAAKTGEARHMRETLHAGAALWLACVKLLEADGHTGGQERTYGLANILSHPLLHAWRICIGHLVRRSTQQCT